MVLLEPWGCRPVSGATPRRFHSPEHYRWKATATLGQFHRQRSTARSASSGSGTPTDH